MEMDTSIECAELTLGYWLALSMSDVIVTQSDPTDGGGAQVKMIMIHPFDTCYLSVDE